jgi:alpha-glucuronidase
MDNKIKGRFAQFVETLFKMKDACLLYFQQFSRIPVPFDMERPVYNLEDLIKYDMNRQ